MLQFIGQLSPRIRTFLRKMVAFNFPNRARAFRHSDTNVTARSVHTRSALHTEPFHSVLNGFSLSGTIASLASLASLVTLYARAHVPAILTESAKLVQIRLVEQSLCFHRP
jgi:hypothetical protein